MLLSGMETPDKRSVTTRAYNQQLFSLSLSLSDLSSKHQPLIGSPIHDKPLSSCCSSCVVTFYWIRMGAVRQDGERNRSKTREGLRSLGTCNKTQYTLLKTAKGRNVCQQWAKSRLPGSRDREMKAAGSGGNWGLGRRGYSGSVGVEGHLVSHRQGADISVWFQPARALWASRQL